MAKQTVLRLRDLQAIVDEAMTTMTGDEPIALHLGTGTPMPVTQVETAGLKTWGEPGLRAGANVIRDPEADCDLVVFLLSAPAIVRTGFWHGVVADEAKSAG